MTSWQDDNDAVAEAVRGKRCSAKGWVNAGCPLCELRLGKRDRKFTLGLNVVSRRYHCFRCGASGRLPDRLGEYGLTGEVTPEPDAPRAVDPPEGFQALGVEPGLSALVFREARAYLAGRGLSPLAVGQAGIGACASGWFGGRVIVPVRAEDGAWLWYVGRTWFKSDRPYLYPKGGRRGVLYNHRALFEDTDDPVLVVEGCFDALALAPDGVAVLGKPSPENVVALCEARRPVCFVLDGDAHDEGWALAMQMRMAGRRAGSLHLPPKVDPDELDAGYIRACARRAVEAPGGEVRL